MLRISLFILLLIGLAAARGGELPPAAPAGAAGEPASAAPTTPAGTAGQKPEVAGKADEGKDLDISADILEWDEGSFAAAGNVRIVYGDTMVMADRALGWRELSEAYVEGNVLMIMPDRTYSCDRGFANWDTGEVVFEDFRVRSRNKSDRLTWYVATPLGIRIANEIVVAKDAQVSNCDYAVPHQFIRAREIVLKPNGTAIVKGVTYYVRGVPMPVYLPALIVPAGRPSITASFGSSSRLGTYGRIAGTFRLPTEFIADSDDLSADATLKLGYFSERGMAYGVGIDYSTPLIALGHVEYYALPDDHGEDVGGQELGTSSRYRTQWLHSMDSPAGWELDVELHKYGDAGFQREFFRSSYFNEKQPEDRVYVKYAHDNWAGFMEGKVRMNDYLDETERLPFGGVRGFSQPLGGGLLWTSDSEFGFLRRRLTDLTFAERRQRWDAFQTLPPVTSDELMGANRTVFRFSTTQEVSRPFAAGPIKIEPFAGVREIFYDTRLEGERDVARNQLYYGSRFTTSMYEMYDANSELLQIDGIRHIVTPDVVYVSRTDVWGPSQDELIQLDDTETISREEKVALRLRNQFQTRRRDKVVDVLDLDLETDVYPRSARDHDGEQFSPLRIDARLQPMERVRILSTTDYDFSGRDRGLNFFNVAAGVDLSDRWSASLGHTYERDFDTYATYSLAYRMTSNWTAAFTNDRDWTNGRSLNERVELVRDFHEFSLSLAIENDRRQDNKAVTVNLEPKSVKMPPKPSSFVHKLVETEDEEE